MFGNSNNVFAEVVHMAACQSKVLYMKMDLSDSCV